MNEKNDLISRWEAIKIFDDYACDIPPVEVIDEIRNLPVVDAEYVRHDRWTEVDASYWRFRHDGPHQVMKKKYKHDACGKVVARKEKYCHDSRTMRRRMAGAKNRISCAGTAFGRTAPVGHAMKPPTGIGAG